MDYVLHEPLVLEGPDGGGKTTLGTALAKMGLVVHHSGGPPQSAAELMERCRFVGANSRRFVFDRIPQISEPVYRRTLDEEMSVAVADLERSLAGVLPVVVYCRPSQEKIMQAPVVVRPHKSAEHAEKVQARRWRLLYEYDRYMARLSCRDLIRVVFYDYEVDPERTGLVAALVGAEVITPCAD